MKSDRQKAIAEVKCEIAMRGNVYPEFINSGRISQEQADGHVADLTLALRYLELPEPAADFLEMYCPREIGEPCVECLNGACRLYHLVRLVESGRCPRFDCDGETYLAEESVAERLERIDVEPPREKCEWCDTRRRLLRVPQVKDLQE